MKVLYAVQATGNGHLSRAIEFYPIMSRYAEVDVLVSGIQGDLKLNFPVKYKFHGAGFVFGQKGGIDYFRSIRKARPFRFFYDVFRLNLKKYDLIISDFEPISTWASKWTKVKRVGLSHQASFLSPNTPRPKKKNRFGEFIYKSFAPVDRYIGLHYKSYDDNIYTPVVRKEIRELNISTENHVVVYLPAYHEDVFRSHLKKMSSTLWKVFSKHATEYSQDENVEIFPIDNENWMKNLASAAGAIIGAGFASTSEMLFLKKKFIVIPMLDQYEQVCNAVALSKMGVRVIKSIGDDFVERIQDWLDNSRPVDIHYPVHSEKLIKQALGIK